MQSLVFRSQANHNEQKQPNQYIKQLKYIAKISEYEPVASIPQQSKDFIYTISKSSLLNFGSARVKRKQRENEKKEKNQQKFYEKSKQEQKFKGGQIKLTTILQNQGQKRNIFLPKIDSNKRKGQRQQKIIKIQKLRSFFKRDTTESRASKDLTIDTRMQTDQDTKLLNSRQLIEQKSLIHRNAVFSPYSDNSQISYIYAQQSESKIDSYGEQKLLNLEDEQQETDQEFDKSSVPGPGSYTYSYSQFDKKKTTRSTNASFLSKVTRFRYEQEENEEENQLKKRRYLENCKRRELQIEKLKKSKSKKKVIPFNAITPRLQQYQDKCKQKMPGPLEYSPRQGIQQDLIRKIQRNFKSNFGSCEKRFFSPVKEGTDLGPGKYNSQRFDDSILSNQNFYFLSKKQRFSNQY